VTDIIYIQLPINFIMILKVTIHCDLSETEAKFHFFFKPLTYFTTALHTKATQHGHCTETLLLTVLNHIFQ